MPISAASATAARLTASDSRTIANSVGSPFEDQLPGAQLIRHVPPPPALFGKNSATVN